LRKKDDPATEILAVSIDSHELSKKLHASLGQKHSGDHDFPFLEDKDHKVIDRYGLLNPDGKGWPHPATYVIDKKGVVRWKIVEVNYRLRPTNDQILAALKDLP
jgi:alkyl hydroperoxide reductase subunit AhpC